MREMVMQYEELTLFDTDETWVNEAVNRLRVEQTADYAMTLGELAVQFAGVERVPRYTECRRENDAEHSFMLALVATELAARYCPWLDHGLVSQFSTVHDLVELRTGDIATFTLDDAGLARKERDEHQALNELAASLPPHTRQLLQRYEAQEEDEARFVRLVDKILPVIVDIVGPGAQVMREDYGIETIEQLDANEERLSGKLRERFPDRHLSFLHQARSLLAAQFATTFEAAAIVN